jgi:hypothetical protein
VPPLPGPRGEDAPPAVRPATGRVKRAADLTARLVSRGLAPVAVPLDHDPALAAILPYLVRVVPAAPEQ